RSAHCASLESGVPSCRQGWAGNQTRSGPRQPSDIPAASGSCAATGPRSLVGRLSLRSVDMPSHRSSYPAPLRRELSCGSPSQADEVVGFFGAKTRTSGPRARRTGHSELDRASLAIAQKKASQVQGSIVFVDETGVFLTPFVHRTWALRGQTPVLQTRT